MKKFNISAEELVQFFVQNGAKHSKGPGGFMIDGKSIDPVETLRDAFRVPDDSSTFMLSLPVSSFYQVNISESETEYPVQEEFNLVA